MIVQFIGGGIEPMTISTKMECLPRKGDYVRMPGHNGTLHVRVVSHVIEDLTFNPDTMLWSDDPGPERDFAHPHVVIELASGVAWT